MLAICYSSSRTLCELLCAHTRNDNQRPAHLGLGHVQQAHRVAVTVEKRSDGVQSLVKLPLDVGQLLEHLAGRPQQHLDSGGAETLQGLTRPSLSLKKGLSEAHLPPPGLAVVQVAQVENPQQQVGKVQVLVQSLQTQTHVRLLVHTLGGCSQVAALRGHCGTYLLVLGGETRPVQLVDGHHDGHHVLAVQDGDGQNALCLVLSEFVHKVAEMRALRSGRRRRGGRGNGGGGY